MRFRIFLLVFLAATLTHSLRAQDLTGSTELDVDPSTNMVTATCETDIDDAYYEAEVSCSVVDGAGKLIAHQDYTDSSGQGYAQVVLTFQGQPGTNYIANASHNAALSIVDRPEDPSKPTYYEDPYNFSYYEQSGARTYPHSHIWVGPGPQVQTRRQELANDLPSLLLQAKDIQEVQREAELAGAFRIESAIPSLIQLLSGRNYNGGGSLSTRRELENDPIARALYDIGKPALPALQAALKSRNRETRSRVEAILILTNTPESRAILQNHLALEPDGGLRAYLRANGIKATH